MIRKIVVATTFAASLTFGIATPAWGHAHVHTPHGCQNVGGPSAQSANGLHVAQHASAKIIPGVCGH